MKIKTLKPRNFVARAVLDPKGLFRPKTERDRTKYTRKVKHRKGVDTPPQRVLNCCFH